MKVLGKAGRYLEKQRKFNQKIGIAFLIVGLATIVFGVGVFLIVISLYFFSKSSHYSKGIEGETQTVNALKNLGEGYYLINDVSLPQIEGNIDHILLGPEGIFVIESKNFEGDLRCEGDVWYQYKPSWRRWTEIEIKSPSKQVKRNAIKLKKFIESQNIFNKPLRPWVHGIVVFTNPNVKLKLKNITVPVLKIKELYAFIKNQKSDIHLSQAEVKAIAEAILSSGLYGTSKLAHKLE
jgi:hypothetical protein